MVVSLVEFPVCPRRSGSAGRLGSPDRILIVEDDVLIATQMEAALTDAGFDVTGVARTGGAGA